MNRTFLINLLHVSYFNFFLLLSITRNAIWGNYRPLQHGRSKYEVKVIWIKTLQAFAPILSHGFISILSEKVDKALVFWYVQGILKWKTDVKCVNKQSSNGKFRPATLLKVDFNADDFLWNLQILKNINERLLLVFDAKFEKLCSRNNSFKLTERLGNIQLYWVMP